jgi:hypothetical protein
MAGSLKRLIGRVFTSRDRAVLECVEAALDALEYRNENGIHAARAKLYEARSYLLR